MNSEILLVGLGQIGSIVAAHLGRDGHKITAICHHRDTAAFIAANGLHIRGIKNIDLALIPTGIDNLISTGARFHYILVCTKATANPLLATTISRLLAPDGIVVCLQNGLGVEEPFQQILGPDRVARGVLNFAGVATAPGQVTMTYEKTSQLGMTDGNNIAALDELGHHLNKSGLSFEITADIRHASWEKTLLGAPISCLSALTGQTIGQTMDSPHTAPLVKALFSEALLTATATGLHFPENFWDTFVDYNRAAAAHTPSMRGDVAAGRVTEACYTIGHIVTSAGRQNLNLPQSTIIYALLRAIDEKNT